MDDAVAVVLAAGLGTRMKSELPKVLIPVLGRPMIEYVLDALATAGITRTIVVVRYQDENVQKLLAGRPGIEFELQSERIGTGRAVKMAAPLLAGHRVAVAIVTEDSPMLQASSLCKWL